MTFIAPERNPMSLAMPVASPAEDDAREVTANGAYVCDTSESLVAAIEKCLDNGLGTCLVVESNRRFVGRLSLDDIGHAIRGGALLAPSLDHQPALFARGPDRACTEDNAVLKPELDGAGNLVRVRIDRSNQPINVARPDMSRTEFRFLLDAFLSSWISSKGPYVQKFEQEFSSYIGLSDGVAVCN